MDVTQRLRIFRPDDLEPLDCGTDALLEDEVSGPLPELDENCPDTCGRSPRSTLSLLQQIVPVTSTLLLLGLISGCSALRPLKGVPVRKLPMEMRFSESRADMETIDLSRLGQTPLPAHLIDSGDVLAIYIEGVLGRVEEAPPVYLPQNAEGNPSFGYPIPVREDGTVSLPLISPLLVRGMTVAQVEEAVRRAYTADRQILQKGRERILVSLQKARTYKITVLRQESSNVPMVSMASGGSLQLGQSKKGTGQIVVLQAGENDVLHALTLSGGLPGLDAQNAIYVLRRPRPSEIVPQPVAQINFRPTHESGTIQLTSAQIPVSGSSWRYGQPAAPPMIPGAGHSLPIPSSTPIQLEPAPAMSGNRVQPAAGQFANGYGQIEAIPAPPTEPAPAPADGGHENYLPPELQPYLTSGVRVIRIPIRLHPGEVALFGEPDIVLFDGDILFIESRQTEIFYTGGLLGGGQFQLPRDYDLDVLDAISIAQGREMSSSNSGGFGSRIGGISAVNQDISVSASDLIIMRRCPDGSRMNIRVDLNRALRDQNENLRIQPGDHLILRYKPLEAVGAFIERNLLAGSLIGLASQQGMGGR